MRVINKSITLSAMTVLLSACGGEGGSSSSEVMPTEGVSVNPDLVLINYIDDTTGFMVAIDSSKSTEVSNANGVELNPATGLFVYNGYVYTSGSLANDTVVKYSLNGDTFVHEGELSTGQNARVGSLIFASETKAYAIPLNLPELQIFNPSTMEKTGAIDLSSYAIGDADTNPNASSGVIREGKLYLALAQIDTMQTFKCQAGASVVIIDIESDTVEKHIQDDRACMSGTLEPNNGLVLDELGDIYVNNLGSYGYYPEFTAGYLRIPYGSDEFDPDYYFSTTSLTLEEVSGGSVSYLYREQYAGDGIVHGNFFVPALSSNPPDYVNDKNYLAYQVDLRNQTVTAVDIPATTGWSADSTVLDDGRIVFTRTADTGVGLYYFDPSSGTMTGDQTPSITTEGSPAWIKAL